MVANIVARMIGGVSPGNECDMVMIRSSIVFAFALYGLGCPNPTDDHRLEPDAQEGDDGLADISDVGTDAPEAPNPDAPDAAAPTVDFAHAGLTSHIGTRFVLVDLADLNDQPEKLYDSDGPKPVQVVVSNPSDEVEVELVVSSIASGGELSLTEAERRVPPGGLRTFSLPSGHAQVETGINRHSWLLESNSPVVVRLLNGDNARDTVARDAMLLFPIDTLGKEYRVMGWTSFWTLAKGRDASGDPVYGFGSHVTVVATDGGETSVTLEPTVNVPEGTELVYTLEQGQVLSYATDPIVGEVDLTGTRITSDKPVAVFSSHSCAFVPAKDVPFCDHFGSQLLPIDAWGDHYVLDLFEPRGEGDFGIVRVMAARDGTVVSADPAVPELASVVLNAGEWLEYPAVQSHLIEASAPLQVGHFMVGSNFDGFQTVDGCGDILATGIGDPGLIIGIAPPQYLDAYTVWAPPGYAEDYLNVVREAGVDVWLDGQLVVEAGEGIGETTWELVRVPVEDGPHRVAASEAFGVTVYGYDCDVSYAYPGGARVAPLD